MKNKQIESLSEPEIDLYHDLEDILYPESIASKDLLDEAIDLLLNIQDILLEQEEESIKNLILTKIATFLNLIDEKNEVSYE